MRPGSTEKPRAPTTHLGHLVPAIAKFPAARILCLGDIMLDRFVIGQVDRISPEAPIPVINIKETLSVPGAVGNVARNVASLGGKVTLISVVGDDDEGRELVRLMSQQGDIEPNLLIENTRKTTVKMRFVAGSQQLLRADREDISVITTKTEAQLVETVQDKIADSDVLVVSDYAKGVLTDRVLSAAIAAARAVGKAVLVDPKRSDFAFYRGATVVKPNRYELAAAAGSSLQTEQEVEASAARLLSRFDIEALLITQAERGMTLVERNCTPIALPAKAQEVFDVSGAGDTSIASLALGLAVGLSLADAAAIANHAAGIAVAKRGTAVVYPRELSAALHSSEVHGASEKVLDPPAALEVVSNWRQAGASIGFTNGCFDLIHPGHVALLSEARAQCDRLVVGLNTDRSVRTLKGPDRPINTEMARALVLASLASVDLVVLFDEDTPFELIKLLRPDLLVKGADYTIETVVGADFVQSYGGRVHLAKLVPGMSTTKTIKKINI